MRSYNILKDLLIVTLLVVANDGADPTICTSSADCAYNECCVWDSAWSYDLKKCAPLLPKGGECLTSNDQLLKSGSNFSISVCPCERGYSCESYDDITDKGTCVKRCSSKKNCAAGECCQSLTRPSNRAKRELYEGTCQQYGAKNASCYVLDTKDDVVNFLCPCESGLNCQGTGGNFNELPTGEAGRCVPVDTNDKAIPGK